LIASPQSIDSIALLVRQGKAHSGGWKMKPLFRLEPSWFASIQDEVTRLITTQPGSAVHAANHPTHWVRPYGEARQYSLFNTSGRTDDLGFGANNLADNKRFWLDDLPQLGRLINVFAPYLINFRLNELNPSSGLNPHEEAVESKKGLVLRFHIPIFTNPDAWLVLDEEKFHFEEGVLYFFNKGCVHAALNQGTQARLHFVFDMYLTPEVTDFLFSGHPPSSEFLPLPDSDVDRLSAGIAFPVEEYVEGRNSGEIILFKRASQNAFAPAVKLSRDICDHPSLSFGDGWWGFEEWQGQTFRWAGPETSLTISALRDGSATLVLDLEPGISAESAEVPLTACDPDGAIYSTLSLGGRSQWRIPIALHKGSNIVRITAESAAKPIEGDVRLLSVRVFKAELQDS
jgi:hypothetical protein